MALQENAPVEKRQRRFAALPESQQEDLAAERAYFTHERLVEIPNLPDKAKCTWRITYRDGAPHEIDLDLTTADTLKGDTPIAEMHLVRREEDGQPLWYLRHRKVHKDYKERGIGSYLLATAEETVADLLRARPDGLPNVIGVRSSQPSVIGLMTANQYEVKDPEQLKEIERFKREREEHADDPAWLERGELPSFLYVKFQFKKPEGGYDDFLDMVVIDKAKLAAYGPQPTYELVDDHLAGNPEYGLQSKFKVLRAKYGTRLPFTLGVEFRKTISV